MISEEHQVITMRFMLGLVILDYYYHDDDDEPYWTNPLGIIPKNQTASFQNTYYYKQNDTIIITTTITSTYRKGPQCHQGVGSSC